MKLNNILFVDLDDTLFQTLAKHSGDSTLEPIAFYKSGDPCSYTTEKQRMLFNLLDSTMTIIPTTARDLDAFRRVKLTFSSYIICNFGGTVITPSGEIDINWKNDVIAKISPLMPSLNQLTTAINDFCMVSGYPGRAKIVSDCGIDFYLVIKDPEKKTERLEAIENAVVLPWIANQTNNFFIHRNANNLAVVPTAINKAHAVEYVTSLLKNEHPKILTFGMGDSKSDAQFMTLCDYAIIPKVSQLRSHMEKSL